MNSGLSSAIQQGLLYQGEWRQARRGRHSCMSPRLSNLARKPLIPGL